jgi:hypothetical protein
MPSSQADVVNAVRTLTCRRERTTAQDVAIEPATTKAEVTLQLMAAYRAGLLTTERPSSGPPDDFLLTRDGERALADVCGNWPEWRGNGRVRTVQFLMNLPQIPWPR